ncbi:SDR family NAD(P)-dependent oxidoreductase [Nocardia sp. CDC153]|uniref:SDR family NAD(P)-dependent oxidoreductase n=1 Tax=Nocardia sp. CDC153 TaxID=3112167 RepID=UPI002DBB5E1B|nr:SDR family NAD(P)-dependent oxidoreductase [Nocardia sp. CDC153]MEC3953132.1 SDR family NAD(P)-dependent oxidoreductase [Nocardia sp. CDC153]
MKGPVLVTGCSSGIGRATALALVKAGLPTWASARRRESLTELEAAGCHTIELDVTIEESRVNAVATIENAAGRLGALVNNAGYSQIGPVEEVSLESLRQQFETNVFGLIRLCQLVLPGMREQHGGTIVNLGSAAGLVTPPASAAYSMTKYSLEALSDALRFEVRDFGVRVVLLEPGAVRSEFIATGQATMPIGSGPYEAFKHNVITMIERTHRPTAGGVLDANTVADVIVKAITAKSPKARYRIGSQARVMPRVRHLLGDRLWDATMRRLVPTGQSAPVAWSRSQRE